MFRIQNMIMSGDSYWQTVWTIEDQAENLNSIARPYDTYRQTDRLFLWEFHSSIAYRKWPAECDIMVWY